MKETNHTFLCERGEMYLSQRMAEQLSKAFGNNHRRASEASGGLPERRWVCYKCAIAGRPHYIKPVDDNVCPQCGDGGIDLEPAWFCPGCGVPIGREGEGLTCPVCHKSLKEYQYELVEVHPHRKATGEW